MSDPYRPCHVFRELFARVVYVMSLIDYGLMTVASLPRAMAAPAMAIHAVFALAPAPRASFLLSA